MSAPEQWRPISGHERYLVSTHGKVMNGRTGRILKPGLIKGYLKVTLTERAQRLVHRLVLEAFVGPCPDGMQCLHGDGNHSNNNLDNLKWGTPAENAVDRHTHGTMPTKVDAEQVQRIRALYAAGGRTYQSLGDEVGLTRQAVHMIVTRQCWAHLPAARGEA